VTAPAEHLRNLHYSSNVKMPTHSGTRLGDQWIALNRWYVWTEYGWELGGHLTTSMIRWWQQTLRPDQQGEP
jgi:hypothetical protein